MLMGVIDRGTGTRAKIGRPAAGKTGTTSDYHDAWFVGYTPDLVAGVWIGQDNNASLGGMGGGNQPAEIWASFMKKALESTPAHNFHGVTVERRGKVGEIKDDNKKGDNKKKETDKNKKTGGQNQSNNENTPPSRDNNVEDEAEREPSGDVSAETPAPPAPAPTPTPTPASEPPGNAPTPGGGVSKSE